MASDERTEPEEPIEGRWQRTPVSSGKYVQTTVHVDRPCAPYVASAGQRPRCAENRGGDFYTDCQSCIVCDVPHLEAPDLMAYVAHPKSAGGGWHCVFTKRPTTPDEIERAIGAMCASEVCGIRYGGSDPKILARIVARGGQDGTDRSTSRRRR